jgi:hypothetical protein
MTTVVDRRSLSRAPERTIDQRLTALERANEIRVWRAQLKKDLTAGRTAVAPLLLASPVDDRLATMKVFDLVIALPRYGRVKANRILRECRVSPSKTIGGLSPRQRRELAQVVRAFAPRPRIRDRRTQPPPAEEGTRSRTPASTPEEA